MPPDAGTDRIDFDESRDASAYIVVARGDDVLGIIRREWVLGHPLAVARAANVAQLCEGDYVTVNPDTTLFELLVRFAETGADAAVVLAAGDGEFASGKPRIRGIVTKAHLAEVIAEGTDLF